MSPAGERPPQIDHRAHVLRIALEAAHILAIIGAVVSIGRTGMSVATGMAIGAAIVLTALLIFTPRPPMPKADR
jgi:hypothetical protein